MKDAAHFDLEHLVAYRAGELPPAEVEEVQDHLADCSTCTQELLDLAAWNQALEEPVSSVLERRRRQSFEALRQRIHTPAGESTAEPVEALTPPSTSSGSVRWLALAAGLVLMAGLAAQFLATLNQLDERESELVSAQAQVAHLEQELAAEEAERQRSEGELASAQTRVEVLEKKLAEVPQGGPPQEALRIQGVVRPLFTLRSDAEPTTAMTGAEAHRLSVPPGSPTKIHVDLTAFAHLPALDFSLLDHRGRVCWQEMRRSSQLHGDLGSELSFEGLLPGRYYLRVTGQDPGRILEEVIFEVSSAGRAP